MTRRRLAGWAMVVGIPAAWPVVVAVMGWRNPLVTIFVGMALGSVAANLWLKSRE